MDSVNVVVEGDLDLRGTLGVARDVPVGFQAIRVSLHLGAPDADERERSRVRKLTEQYCVVMQTLLKPPGVEVTWV